MNYNFSDEEWQFLSKESPMKLKPGIIQKLDLLLWETHEELVQTHSNKLNIFQEWKGLPQGSARIFKGENYLGLPWIALDSFAQYSKESSLSFRILIVWGQGAFLNFFADKKTSKPLIENSLGIESLEPVFILKGKDAWIQHIDENQGQFSSIPMLAVDFRKEFGYTRLINHISFSNWNSFSESAVKIFDNQVKWMQFILQHQDE
ncbi:MAG: hypothetical protein WED33_05800 [Bacteroidia bacterium]